MQRWFSYCLIAVIMLLTWIMQPIAWAEAAAPSKPAEPPTEQPSIDRLPSTENISSEKLSQFVRAYLQVVKLIDQREGELQGAETKSESLQIQQEVEAEALSLIEATGLTLQEYLQLLSLANLDPEFGDRVAVQLQETGN
jgi:hypothetical protein